MSSGGIVNFRNGWQSTRMSSPAPSYHGYRFPADIIVHAVWLYSRFSQMRRFKSAAHLQRFAPVHGVVQNLFRVGRHLLRSVHHRLLRTRAFIEWQVATCAC